MEVTLEQILAEVKSVKVEMQNIKNELRTEIDSKLKEQTKTLRSEFKADLKAQTETLRNEFNAKLEEHRSEFKTDLKAKTETLRNEFKADLKAQTKEITQDYQDLIHYLEKKHKRQEKINDEMLRELRDNRLAHQSYDARLYKIEASQTNLETKLYGILPA